MKNTITAIKKVASLTENIILFSSLTGKDSIAILDLCAPYFKRIIVLSMYKVKGMKYIEKYKNWALNRYSNIEIIEVAHPVLVSYIKAGFLGIKKDPNIKTITPQKLIDSIKETHKDFEWVCWGQKKRDSVQAAMLMCKKDVEYQIIAHKTKKFYPLSNWTQKDVLAYIDQKGLIKPIKYNNDKSQSVELHSIDYLLWVRENSPSDLEQIYKYFPLCKLKLFEYDYQKTIEAI